MTTTPDLLPRKLRIFAAVYDMASTTAAAEAVGITQSAVSKSIAQLEAEFGVQLFERTPQGLRPMPTAEALRKRTRWLAREIDFANAEIQNTASLANVELRIGSGPVWNVKLLPEVLPGFCAQHPQIRLDIATGSGDYLVPRMINGHFDIYFGVLSEDFDRPGLHCEPLLDMELQIFVRQGHPLLTQGAGKAGRLADYPWIGFSSDDQLEGNVHGWAREMAIPARQFSLRIMSLTAMMAVARASDHVVFAVDALEYELTKNGLVKLPFEKGPGRVISGYAVRSSIFQLPPIENLISRARRCCQSQPSGALGIGPVVDRR